MLRFICETLALISVCIAFIALAMYNSCQAYEENTGRRTRYAFVANCYIQDDDGKWWVWEEWKLRGAAKGQ